MPLFTIKKSFIVDKLGCMTHLQIFIKEIPTGEVFRVFKRDNTSHYLI